MSALGRCSRSSATMSCRGRRCVIGSMDALGWRDLPALQHEAIGLVVAGEDAAARPDGWWQNRGCDVSGIRDRVNSEPQSVLAAEPGCVDGMAAACGLMTWPPRALARRHRLASVCGGL